MCIPQIAMALITARTRGIWTAERVEAAVATEAAGEPAVIKDGATAVPVTQIVVDPAAHPMEKAPPKNCRATWCDSLSQAVFDFAHERGFVVGQLGLMPGSARTGVRDAADSE